MPIGYWLKGVHNVSIATIKGQVVPCPVGHCANFVSAAKNVKQVQPKPRKPCNGTSNTNAFNFNDCLVATNSSHRAFVFVFKVLKWFRFCDELNLFC